MISIIIVNWKSKDFVRACLTSISRHCDPRDVEVVVVDGGSFDGCAEMVTREFPSVIFVQSPENIGFARANNLGVQHSSADLLLFLNPDTELLEDSPAVLRRHLESLPSAGIVACTLLNSDRSVQTSCVQRYPTVFNQLFATESLQRWFPGLRFWGVERWDETQEVEVVIGACICMKRELFDKVGGFNDGYFMYGEDLDLCFKVRQANYRVYHVGDTQIVHHSSGSTPQQLSNFSNLMMRESVYRFLNQHSGALNAHAYRAAMGLSAILRIGLSLGVLGVTWLRNGKAGNGTASLRKWVGILRWSLYLSRAQRPAAS
jgi:GT2 family glycosyltransferase